MVDSIELISWFTVRQEESRARAEALRADLREDEAVRELVAANVYGMFGAIFQVAARQTAELSETKVLFLSRAEPIAVKWEESRQRAEMHGDDGGASEAKLKLDVYSEIIAAVAEFTGKGFVIHD